MSSLSNKVDVLVVGAGPSGLLAALQLAKAGVEVEIIDRAWRSAAQSYACGLHASTLALFARTDLELPATESGMRVDKVGFFNGETRQAELQINLLHTPFPFVLVFPQDQLEELLERHLHDLGVRVRWGHRLDDLRQDENSVSATVEKLGVTSVGYPFARSEEAVEKSIEVRARFLVGADGCNSHVRNILGIKTERLGLPAIFEVFEFAPSREADREVQVAMGPDSTDVFWPQPGSMGRWSLQQRTQDDSHPEKERDAFVVLDDATDRDARQRIEAEVRARAPWYSAGIKQVDWTTLVGFESMMAQDFGRGRCWLTGDAAHQTSPVGMQSMNVGLREAVDLAGRLAQILTQSASTQQLAEYAQTRREEWATLLGADARFRPGPKANSWVRQNHQRLLPCLPGSGDELVALAGQIGIERA